jgi:hypothetical protein
MKIILLIKMDTILKEITDLKIQINTLQSMIVKLDNDMSVKFEKLELTANSKRQTSGRGKSSAETTTSTTISAPIAQVSITDPPKVETTTEETQAKSKSTTNAPNWLKEQLPKFNNDIKKMFEAYNIPIDKLTQEVLNEPPEKRTTTWWNNNCRGKATSEEYKAVRKALEKFKTTNQSPPVSPSLKIDNSGNNI